MVYRRLNVSLLGLTIDSAGGETNSKEALKS